MKENKCERCPGCGRHCRRDELHCKHGVAYFEKRERKERKPEHKWEENLTADGLAHRFIHTARGMKKRMARGKISEEALLSALSASEQVSLDEILNRLAPMFHKKYAEKYPGQGV